MSFSKMNSMNNTIRFRGYLTFGDSLKVQQAMVRRRLVSPSVLITAATFAATAFLIYRMQIGVLIGIFLLIFMSVSMLVGFRFMRSAAAKAQRRIYEKACRKRTGILTTEGITIRKNKAVTTLPWDAFEKAIEIEGVVAVLKGMETLGFAKYMFDTAADWDRAKGLVLSRYAPPAAEDS